MTIDMGEAYRTHQPILSGRYLGSWSIQGLLRLWSLRQNTVGRKIDLNIADQGSIP